MISEDGKKGLAEVLSDNAEGILVGVLVVALLAALIVGGFYLAFFKGEPVSGDPANWGQLGDYLGGVLNPIFGFLSVFALLVALVLQTRELKLSRESLRLSQEEQAKASAALAEQNRAIHRQSFEQTFFSMLSLLSRVLDSCVEVPLSSGLTPTTGRQALGLFLQIQPCLTDADGEVSQQGAHRWRDSFLIRDTSGYVNQYVRTLRAVIEYLMRSGVEKEEPYAVILRSQLGPEELRLVSVFCFLEDWAVLKQGVERYGLLANLRRDDVGVSVIPLGFFHPDAFDEKCGDGG